MTASQLKTSRVFSTKPDAKRRFYLKSRVKKRREKKKLVRVLEHTRRHVVKRIEEEESREFSQLGLMIYVCF